MKTKQITYLIAILILGIFIGKYALSGNNNNLINKSSTAKTVTEHWTCSMHPQIDMPEFGSCPICGMDLIPKTDSDEGLALNSFKMTKNAIALANIQTIIVGEKNEISKADNSLKLSGKIQENENKTAVQTAHFGGRIEKLYYKSEGEFVKKGTLIASLYSPELVTAQNEFIEALEIKNAQPELYNAVRNKLKNWKISEKQINQIERNKKVITNFNMYANVSGYISSILVQEGSHVKEGTPLFKVSNLTTVWAVLDVYEKDIPKIKKGMPISMKLNSYPNKEFKGKVNYIDPILNTKTRITIARVTLLNKKNLLKPGMIVTARVEVVKNNLSNKSVINIPKSAVMWTGERSVVYVKTNKEESIFEMREVELGNDTKKSYQILSGINNGDEVVVNGTFTIDATAQLLGKKSMMNQKKDDLNKKEGLTNKIIKIEVNPKFKKQLNAVFTEYLKLKNTLVLTDSVKANKSAKNILTSLSKVNMKLLKKPKTHKIWMPSSKKIKKYAEDISKEKDIEKQRKLFSDLSNEIIVLAKTFGVEKTIYVQHCPMANDNNGGDWLSAEEKIQNPYFGDKMMRCGSVKATIE